MSDDINLAALPDFSEGRQSITIADARHPEMPLVYVSPGFERFSGYARDEALGRSCRFLQGKDRDQPGVEAMRQAIRQQQSCLVDLINYRRDGSRFYNRLSLQPVHDGAGILVYYVGLQSDVTSLVSMQQRVGDYLDRLGLKLSDRAPT